MKIILRSGKDDALRRFHPWVFSGAIKKTEGRTYEGCLAEVFSNKDEYLGSGIYQDAAIAVRILAFAPERPESFDQDFWEKKIHRAFDLRKLTGLTDNPHTNVYRLVHGEGDHLPGLIVDHYNGHLVIQIHSTGLYTYIDQIAEALIKVYGNQLRSIYDKSRETLPVAFWEKTSPKESIYGECEKTEVLENGHRFVVDIDGGQKTGFYIDQRDNRKLLAGYCKGKEVLNTFCYSGGFSVYALKAGASGVDSLDSSAKATALAEENVSLNIGPADIHQIITDDAIRYLNAMDKAYDVIILDPPAYAKHQHVKHKAVQGYKRLNLAALKKIQEGGVLFTFSCSQVVDMQLFRSTVMAAAIQSGRTVRILHQLTQPSDHPVNIFHPEGQYLKGLVLFVD